MIAPRKPRQRHDHTHTTPSPAQVRRRQRLIREGWDPIEADRRTAVGITGDSHIDAMLGFLQMLASN